MRYNATQDPREFWTLVGPAGCWEWTGAKDKDGYGQTRIGMRRVKAHRKAWEIVNGPIPDGMLVCHTCDNTSCVRPDHLFLGTHGDNQRDKWAKGRGVLTPQNLTHRQRRFTNEQITEIRSRYATGNVRQRELGEEFGVEQVTISSIVLRKTYKEVP